MGGVFGGGVGVFQDSFKRVAGVFVGACFEMQGGVNAGYFCRLGFFVCSFCNVLFKDFIASELDWAL